MIAPLTLTRPQAAATDVEKEHRPHGRPAREQIRSRVSGMPPEDSADRERIAATATSLAVACLEIFSGIRRSDSIARWVDRELLEKIDHRAQLRAELAPSRPVRDLGTMRTLQAGNARVCRVNDVVAEVTVIVRTQNRFRAVAVRLELLTTRWTMTALQTM